MLHTTNGTNGATPGANSAAISGEVSRIELAARVVLYGASLVHKELDKRQLAVVGANVLDDLTWYISTQRQLAACLDVNVVYLELPGRCRPASAQQSSMGVMPRPSPTCCCCADSRRRQELFRQSPTAHSSQWRPASAMPNVGSPRVPLLSTTKYLMETEDEEDRPEVGVVFRS